MTQTLPARLSQVRSWLLYSEGGAGKSFVLCTSPGPILIADTEGRANLLPRPYTVWDGKLETIPKNLSADSITVVPIGSTSEFEELLRVLGTPEAPWKTFAVDSFTVYVKIAEDEYISESARDARQEYKKLLKYLEPQVIRLKYLAGRDDTQLETVIFTAWQDKASARPEPYMVGAIKTSLDHLFDVIGHVSMAVIDGKLGNTMQIMPDQGPRAKAPGGLLIKYVGTKGLITNPNIGQLNMETK